MSDPDSRQFDIIVVGVGSIGSATCHHLTKKGAKVLGIEQFAIFPGGAGRLTHASTCMYTNSPDGHFIGGNHPFHNHVSIACGLSGHGFKFSSVLGEVLADLALEGKNHHAGEFFKSTTLPRCPVDPAIIMVMAVDGFSPTCASEKYHPDDRIDAPLPGRQVQP